jgi:hypothetical protein
MHTEDCIHFIVFTRLREYIGYLPVRRTSPNSTHHALATLQHASAVGPHNPERRRSTSRSTPPHLTRTRGRSTYSRVSREHLCESLVFVSPFTRGAAHKSPFLKISGFFPVLRNCGENIQILIVIRNREYIVNMDTPTHAQCIKSGLAKRIRSGARSLPSPSA